MADLVLLVFTAVATLSFVVGLSSVLGGIRFWLLVRASYRRRWPPYTPPAAVILAAKGVDAGLERNLAALLNQSYPAYRVIFALDSLEDDAYPVIQAAAANSSVQVTVVAADRVRNATGKAAALIRAARELTPSDTVVVFMDSDATPPRHWLQALVEPLQDSSIGATTTYRWYAHDDSTASATRAAWNAAGTNILFSHRLNFAWGGSYAIRRETFERGYVAAKWGSALSDDMVVTQAVKTLGLVVTYVPRATVLTNEPVDWPGVLEWTTRQTVMMRAYDPRVTRFAGLAYATVAGSLDLSIALAVITAFVDRAYFLPTLLLAAHLPFAGARAVMRLVAFRRITGQRLGPMGRYVLGSFIVPWLTLYNLRVARRLRVISWRGTLYELRGPAPIRVVRR